MNARSKLSSSPIRVLVVDAELAVLDAYRQALGGTAPGLLGSFESEFFIGAETALQAVRAAMTAERPFSVAFLDGHLPSGPDGVGAAERLRGLDPLLEIVICTTISGTDPRDANRRVPPDDRLFWLHKPFHLQEVRQLARALGEKRQGADRRPARQTEIDALTGLPNRADFLRHLAESLETAEQKGEQLALLYIDLDGFRRVNDSLGHSAGDELLRAVAGRLGTALHACHPTNQHCARLGGDEFAVLLRAVNAVEEAVVVGGRVIDALAAPARLASHDFAIAATVGVAIYQGGPQLADTLIRNASVAMHRAKEQGRGKLTFFDESMSAGAQLRFSLESQLQGALQRQEFSLHYQPLFKIGSSRLAGLEALLRWNNEALGSVPPNEFIPVAEDTGLILSVGAWVLREACSQVKAWQDSGLATGRIAVNVSALQFAQRDFPQLIAGILRETRLAPAMLELEITESLLMKDQSWIRQALVELKALGVTVAIDDFGTGYSSFSRLTDFPIDRLKIDRSFVHNINITSSGAAVVSAMIAMAKALSLEVLAEGVENIEQQLHLQEQGCHEVQGYLLSRPLAVPDAGRFLARLGASGRCDAPLHTAESPHGDAGAARLLGG